MMKTAAELWADVVTMRASYQASADKTAKGERGAVQGDELGRLCLEIGRVEREARRQQAKETLTEWRPQNAQHVVGTWPQRTFDENGLPEVQLVKMKCDNCGETWQVPCSSGLVRSHVQRFALVHLHRDVLNHVPRKAPEDGGH